MSQCHLEIGRVIFTWDHCDGVYVLVAESGNLYIVNMKTDVNDYVIEDNILFTNVNRIVCSDTNRIDKQRLAALPKEFILTVDKELIVDKLGICKSNEFDVLKFYKEIWG